MQNTQPGLDLFLKRRLSRSLESSTTDLWTLPSPGIPDSILRSHTQDSSLRALYAFLGAQIFAPALDSAVTQLFDSYPAHVRGVISNQISSLAVLARMAGRLPLYAHKLPPTTTTPAERDSFKSQLLYAAVSALADQHGDDYAARWIKALVGNLVPVIIDAISDWDDLVVDDEELGGNEQEGAVPSGSLLVDAELDDSDLAELLEKHLVDLGE